MSPNEFRKLIVLALESLWHYITHTLCYRCRYDDIYLHPRHVCDNIVHCLLSQDDEAMCDEVCPKLNPY